MRIKTFPKSYYQGPLVALIVTVMMLIGPLSMEFYLPSVVSISHSFHATVSQVQLSVTVILIGAAIGMAICGPLIDYFGRLPVLYSGLVIYIIAALGCLLSMTLAELILFRFIQGLGITSCLIVVRALIADTHEGKEAAKKMNTIITVFTIGLGVSPLLGGLVAYFFHWRATFLTMLLAGIAVLVLTFFALGETLPEKRRKDLHPLKVWLHVGSIITPRFLLFGFTAVFAFTTFITFISNSAYFFVKLLYLDSHYYAYIILFVLLGFIIGSQSAKKLLNYFSVEGVILIGCVLMIVAIIVWCVLTVTMHPAIWLHTLIATILSAGLGLTYGNANMGALGCVPKQRGLAAAVVGLVQYGFGGVYSTVITSLRLSLTEYVLSYLILAGLISIVIIGFWRLKT